MMKLTTKFLAVGAVAALAIAMSVASSEAAKRKRMAAPATCGAMGSLCSTNCSNGICSVMTCGGDGVWYPAFLTPICPQATCINLKKKC